MQATAPPHPQKQLSAKRKFSQVNPAHNQQQGKKKKQKINHEDNGLVIQHGTVFLIYLDLQHLFPTEGFIVHFTSQNLLKYLEIKNSTSLFVCRY